MGEVSAKLSRVWRAELVDSLANDVLDASVDVAERVGDVMEKICGCDDRSWSGEGLAEAAPIP